MVRSAKAGLKPQERGYRYGYAALWGMCKHFDWLEDEDIRRHSRDSCLLSIVWSSHQLGSKAAIVSSFLPQDDDDGTN